MGIGLYLTGHLQLNVMKTAIGRDILTINLIQQI